MMGLWNVHVQGISLNDRSGARVRPAAMLSANDRCLREADGSFRREPDIADRGRGCRIWSDGVLTVAASGTTGVRAKAVVPSQAAK